jgi:hypothetical protein
MCAGISIARGGRKAAFFFSGGFPLGEPAASSLLWFALSASKERANKPFIFLFLQAS